VENLSTSGLPRLGPGCLDRLRDTNPDGLANLGLMLVVLPVTVAGLFIGWLADQESFVLLPDGLGYFGDHALFYAPSVALIALALWLLGRWIDRIRG
jgi:hypothetical protein